MSVSFIRELLGQNTIMSLVCTVTFFKAFRHLITLLVGACAELLVVFVVMVDQIPVLKDIRHETSGLGDPS